MSRLVHVFAVFTSSLLAASSLSGCGAGSLVHQRPTSAESNREVTQMWLRDIKRTARTGDWILTRSYSLNGDLIVAGSGGESISHSSIYDARTGTIIEAVRPSIREVPLEALLDRNRVAIVVRPTGLSESERIASVERARTKVGTEFDTAGLFGFGDDSRFYCSELLYWASRIDGDKPFVITPASLMEYGELIYYSGSRDTSQIQNVAHSQRERLDVAGNDGSRIAAN